MCVCVLVLTPLCSEASQFVPQRVRLVEIFCFASIKVSRTAWLLAVCAGIYSAQPHCVSYQEMRAGTGR